jgi:hypothetical protein
MMRLPASLLFGPNGLAHKQGVAPGPHWQDRGRRPWPLPASPCSASAPHLLRLPPRAHALASTVYKVLLPWANAFAKSRDKKLGTGPGPWRAQSHRPGCTGAPSFFSWPLTSKRVVNESETLVAGRSSDISCEANAFITERKLF